MKRFIPNLLGIPGISDMNLQICLRVSNKLSPGGYVSGCQQLWWQNGGKGSIGGDLSNCRIVSDNID